MTHYEKMIVEDTGCAPEEVSMVEDIMRNEVFHSTLDWQSRAQWRKGAKEAYTILEANRPEYEEYSRKAREVFEKMQLNELNTE